MSYRILCAVVSILFVCFNSTSVFSQGGPGGPGGPGGGFDCWVDVQDPQTCFDEGHTEAGRDYLCGDDCELFTIAYDLETGEPIMAWVCVDDDRTYEEMYENKEISAVTDANENQVGLEDITEVTIVCCTVLVCGCDIGTTPSLYVCVPWDSPGGVNGCEVDGEKSSGDICGQ